MKIFSDEEAGSLSGCTVQLANGEIVTLDWLVSRNDYSVGYGAREKNWIVFANKMQNEADPHDIVSVIARPGKTSIDETPNDFSAPGYEGLRKILLDAYEQSANGKGKERHATDGTPWHDQPIVADLRALGSIHAAVFQARKKALEACRLDYHRARCDLLGAIVYLAAAVRWLDEQED